MDLATQKVLPLLRPCVCACSKDFDNSFENYLKIALKITWMPHESPYNLLWIFMFGGHGFLKIFLQVTYVFVEKMHSKGMIYD